MRAVRLLLAAWLLAAGFAAHAAATLESFRFDSPVQEQRFKALIAEVRCLVCQNQSLLDSDAELAHDLRAEVYGMLRAGDSDAQIMEFLVARYGDFVLYKPPVKPATYLLWFGPFVLLAIALVLLVLAVRRQRRAAARAPITPEERRRLDRILGESATPPDREP